MLVVIQHEFLVITTTLHSPISLSMVIIQSPSILIFIMRKTMVHVNFQPTQHLQITIGAGPMTRRKLCFKKIATKIMRPKSEDLQIPQISVTKSKRQVCNHLVTAYHVCQKNHNQFQLQFFWHRFLLVCTCHHLLKVIYCLCYYPVGSSKWVKHRSQHRGQKGVPLVKP